ADIASLAPEAIYCLGDIVGYGPNPVECLDLSMRFHVALLGNHDQAALFDPEGFSRVAESAIFWTREQLESDGPRNRREDRWEFLATRPRLHREQDRLYVHGSARNPLNEYIFPEDIFDLRKMERIFALVDCYCFQGHTHLPGVFVAQGEEEYQFHTPEE